MISRTSLGTLAAVVAVALAWTCGIARAADRPNVILIMADDMGFECLGCNGAADYQTPHLDRLAANGMRFVHCYSQPLCTPSRVQIMTGKYNFRNYLEFGYLDPADRTFGHMMQEAGYRTCIAGKWQLNGLNYQFPRNQDRRRPIDAGFHESCLWQVTKHPAVGERFADPVVERNGEPAERLEGQYGPQVFADFVCDFIDRNRDESFFVYYPMVLTHSPFVPTPDSPEWADAANRYRKDPRFFADMVAYADRIVGQIDAKLAEHGLRENTILLFTGDNGTQRGHPTRMKDGSTVIGGKGTTPDAGDHVPFVVSWPGTAPSGVVSSDLVDFSDFFPTLAEAAGVPEQASGSDGRSFLPQLRGERGNPREFTFCHYDSRWGNTAQFRDRFARDRVYKLYLDGRLFNVPADVLEQQALAPGDVDADKAREKLQKVLDAMPPWDPQPLQKQTLDPAAKVLD